MKENTEEGAFAIPRKNVLYIIAGFAVMVLGYVLMAGGGSDDPNVFNYGMFSFRRIVLAPVVILVGMVVEIWAIMHIGKSNKGE
ncbi:MAG: DUF3098 domain-containing protein [Bacteroidales bacterium]|nr:DUF3098 domain-containing protein [Bacteroidales bacterium]